MVYISLRLFGYRMDSSRKERRQALVKAIKSRGIDNVIRRLERISANARYTEQTKRDIRFAYLYSLGEPFKGLDIDSDFQNDVSASLMHCKL
jgi:hypothetical protein